MEDDDMNTEGLVMSFPAVQALVRMLEVAPGFREHWEEVKWVTSNRYPIRAESMFTAFSGYIIPRILQGQREALVEVFAFIEEAMLSAHDEWSNGAAVHFLENISNRVPSTLAPDVVIPLMGPESRKYCRAWAEWCGADAADLALWDIGY